MKTMSEPDDCVYLLDVSQICAVEPANAGGSATIGFTITYSNGMIENVVSNSEGDASGVGRIKKQHRELMKLLQQKTTM
ncbi:hypothetical protein MASR2M64_17530 [Candidatus Cloacimonadota bacterium]|jgi:hypothetical protein|nr:hypothetical protein [Candidatus Cloacimonadota bacterium]MDD3235523.1 hypothetical protein [Candidatus Cloacimonadota bacterium]